MIVHYYIFLPEKLQIFRSTGSRGGGHSSPSKINTLFFNLIMMSVDTLILLVAKKVNEIERA